MNELSIAGTTIDHEDVKGKIRFKGLARIKSEGGTLSSNDSTLFVNDANAVSIYISIATNFNSYQDISGNEDERAMTYLDEAYSKTFAYILKAHVTSYQEYFNRVKFDLGVTNAS